MEYGQNHLVCNWIAKPSSEYLDNCIFNRLDLSYRHGISWLLLNNGISTNIMPVYINSGRAWISLLQIPLNSSELGFLFKFIFSSKKEVQRISFKTTDVIVMTEDNLCIVKENGAIVKIGSVKNTIFNANETNGVSWLNDNGGKLQFCWYSNNGKIQTSHSLKSECVWSYILKNGYRYHNKSDNRMSYILWLYKSCQLPVPFTLKNIQTAIAAFETGIARGYIEKTPEYVSIIGFLITLDREGEDMTDALFEHFNIQINDIGYVKKNGVNIYRDLLLKKISG